LSGRGTPAADAVRRAGIAHTLHEFEPEDAASRTGARPSWGLEAAAALGVPPSRVFKTLVAEVDETRTVIGVVPVDAELDLKALAAAVGGRRATLADGGQAQRATGYVVGGISPLGGRRRLPTVIDASALEPATIFVSGGRRGLDIELAGPDLVTLTGATVGHIARRA
jgi:Cys-tRNA(Pro)/Cys-tRNA(Cys) deacylase